MGENGVGKRDTPGRSVNWLRIMTVVSTLKQQDRNVLDYLAQACETANQGRSAHSLLPADPIPIG